MAKATQTFHAYDPDTGESHVFEAGDKVPDSVAATVGDHVLDKPVPKAAKQVDASQFEGADGFQAAVDAKVEEQLEAARAEARQEQRDREQAVHDALAGDTFDPAADGVNAKDVHEYLSGLDRDTAAGSSEFDRVVAAEQAGPNRSSAIPS